MKKGSLSFVMMLVIIIISVFAVMFVSIRLFKMLEVETQSKVCEVDIGFTNEAIYGDQFLWGLEKIAAARVKHPLCKTIPYEINLTKYRKGSDALNEQIAIEMGEMIENCWDTFGEGQYPNTFGQKEGLDDKVNYYFPCYKFKFHLKNPEDTILVSDLIKLTPDEVGLLWKYNTNGKMISESYSESLEKYLDGDKSYGSYADFVFYGEPGYIEFLEYVNTSLGWGISPGQEGLLDLIKFSALVALTPVGQGPIGVVRNADALNLDLGSGAMLGFYDKLLPESGPPLTTIYSEEWYEVRYYSPYIKNPDDYSEVVFNNIKIVPLETSKGGEEISGVIG